MSNAEQLPTLFIHDWVPRSRANGPGVRAVIWTQGCTLGCAGCFNPLTHPKGGTPISVGDLVEEIASISDIEGLTISGGEPLQQASAILRLLGLVRAHTSLSVLMFTGFEWSEIAHRPCGIVLPELVDVLISGRYDHSRRTAAGLIGSESKTVHFFTDRYSRKDLQATPPAELIITAAGDIVATGINPIRLPKEAHRANP